MAVIGSTFVTLMDVSAARKAQQAPGQANREHQEWAAQQSKRHYCIACDGFFETPAHDCQPRPVKIFRPQMAARIVDIPTSPATNWKRHKLFQAIAAEIVRFLPLVGEHIASALLWAQIDSLERKLAPEHG